MMPLPTDSFERRLVILLDEIENVRRYHPEVMVRLGVQIKVLFEDQGEEDGESHQTG
jgi:hypothetical protein